jgi:hypothetical protein
MKYKAFSLLLASALTAGAFAQTGRSHRYGGVWFKHKLPPGQYRTPPRLWVDWTTRPGWPCRTAAATSPKWG